MISGIERTMRSHGSVKKAEGSTTPAPPPGCMSCSRPAERPVKPSRWSPAYRQSSEPGAAGAPGEGRALLILSCYHTRMDSKTLLDKLGGGITAGRSFGPAHEKDGVMVIPVAYVAGGGGAGDDGGS